MSKAQVNLSKKAIDSSVNNPKDYVKNYDLDLAFGPVEPYSVSNAVDRTADYEKLKSRQAIKKMESMTDRVRIRKDGTLTFIDHELSAAFNKKFPTDIKRSIFAVKSHFTAFTASSLTLVSAGVTLLQSNLLFLIPVAFATMLAASNRNRTESLDDTVKLYQPQVKEWLKKSYDINVTNDVSDKITRNMLRFMSTAFRDKDDDIYRVTGRGDRWFLEKYYLKGTGNEYKVMKTTVKSFAPRTFTQESLLVKFDLLNKQKLSTEDKYAVNRAKEEAYEVLQSDAILDTIGNDSHENNLAETFVFLDEEMGKILNRYAREEQDKIAATRNFIAERNHKPEPRAEILRLHEQA